MVMRRITSYAINHHAGRSSEIAVYYEQGDRDIISNLSVLEANYIVDILRNEKPINYDHANRQFISGEVEPVGEKES